MLQDGFRPGKVEQVAEARLEAEHFIINRKAPAVDTGHAEDLAGERFDRQGLGESGRNLTWVWFGMRIDRHME